jgi:dipeptidyl aminopeptidase/acylaminoacyl peptidase
MKIVPLLLLAMVLAMVPGALSSSQDTESRIELRDVQRGERRPIALDDILSTRELQEVQMAPDGQAVAFTLKQAFLERNENRTALFVVSTTGGGRPQKLLESKSIARIRWWPDSRSISYLSSATGSTQLWRVNHHGGDPERVFRHADAMHEIGIQGYELSPDGHRIAFMSTPPVDADEKKQLETRGVIYDADTSPFSWRQIEQRSWTTSVAQVWVYDTQERTERVMWNYSQVAGALPWQIWKLVTDVAWAADGQRLAIEYAALPIIINPPSAVANRQIAVVDVGTGKAIDITTNAISGANPAWSPDGQSIAFMSFQDPLVRLQGDKPYVAHAQRLRNAILMADSAGHKTTSVTRSFAVSDSLLYPDYAEQKVWWGRDGRSLYFMNRLQDRNSLYEVDVRTGTVRAVSQSGDDLSAFSFSDDQALVACIRQNVSMPAEVAVLDRRTGAVRTLTDVNPEYRNVALGAVDEVEWRNTFGYVTNGFLIKPLNYVQGRRYPLLVILYGFRRQFIAQAQWIPNFPAQAFAANGFAVLMMNFPKFSELRKADESNAFGHAYNPLASIEAAVRKMVDIGIADPKRKGILGFSYGGFLTDFTITHSDVFEVASSGDNLYLSPGTYWMTFQEGRDWLEDTVGGPPYGKSYENWVTLSPALNADRVRIPLLKEFNGDSLLGGLEFYTALKFNRAPVEYIVYPEEPHLMTQPVHRFYSMRRNLDWFEFWLQGKEDPDPERAEQYRRWHELRNLRDARIH